MAIINGYTTLQSVKDLLKITATDTTDDAVIEDMIGQVSRYIDAEAGRKFYPRIETRYYNVPRDRRQLTLDDDLLVLTSVTNGDGDAVVAADYTILPANAYPKFAIRLTDTTSEYWDVDSNSNSEQVIDVLGWWGFRQDYGTRAWITGSTLNEGAGLNATDLTFTVTSGTLFKAGQIIKIENEIMMISSVSTHDITVPMRGDNGSTAATHANATPVYIWAVEPQIEQACRMIVKNFYHNRFGQNTSAVATITAAGVVLAPEDIPASAIKIMQSFRRVF